MSEDGDRRQGPDVVRFIRLPNNPDLPLPSRQTAGSAGYDVSSAEEDFELLPGERRAVSTGLRMELPPHFECQVRPRSGLALRHGLTLPNTPATIDPDYRGELKIILWNAGSEPITIRRGMRIAQLVFARFETPAVMEVEELGETSRGSGGFGSTEPEERVAIFAKKQGVMLLARHLGGPLALRPSIHPHQPRAR